ncbi:MAG: hypothetical protein LBV50_10340 [Novosphingobium sp.]|nr:hypothetical protein [Novosphingobium sp.]
MYEHILAAFIALDETEALVGVEEFDDTLALADDLGGHAATTTAAARAAEATTTAAARTSTEAAAIAAAKAAARTTAAAEAITATAAKPVTAAHERVEAILSETVPLVASPSATTSIETHKTECTFASPHSMNSAAWTKRAKRQKTTATLTA